MQNTKLLEEAVSYFKQEGFRRLMLGFQERYASLGHVGGSVLLSNPKEEERDALEGFLQTNCHKQKNLTVSEKAFSHALEKSKFAEVTLEEILEKVCSSPLISKKEVQVQKEVESQKHFQKLLDKFEHTRAEKWLQQILDEKCPPYLGIKKWEKEDYLDFHSQFAYVLAAINVLPIYRNQKMRLPVFAAEITGNPHAFDENKRLFRYLLYGICAILQIEYKNQCAEDRAEILYDAGILKDDISSFVTCYGIRGICEDSTFHMGMNGYIERQELQQLTLSNLSNLRRALTPNKRVYVVENPSVFRYLTEQDVFKNEAIVCGNGQLRIAVFVLLDLLVEENVTIFYAGDFDPEGLKIAQKVIDRYGNNVKLWCYNRDDFMAASVKIKSISFARVKKLQQLKHPSLKKVAEWIMDEKKLGYQENILEHYLSFKLHASGNEDV